MTGIAQAAILGAMTTAAVKTPFADATPAEIRAVLLPEELPGFEGQYREALRVAAETYSLDKLDAVLRTWRRIAWMTGSDPETHCRMLARVEYTQRTGERPPGMASAEEIRALLPERLGQ